MTTILNFLYMNGYGFYVWTSYGSVCAFLFIQWFRPWRRWRKYLLEQIHTHE
jgi:heme exporter protein CcmD